jgi:endonuclease
MRADYKFWLERQKYDAGTITAQLHRAGRVEKYYGDLDQHYLNDRLEGVVAALNYTT